MQYRKLGRTGIEVSRLCLGTMTFGSQNTFEEGHAQIDLALDHGINFLDTAEMYPVNPTSPETQGASEACIGEWFEKTGRRGDVVLATKIVGEGFGHIRGGAPINATTLREAVDASLTRLKTDYIDLYQFHWPNRGSYHFRKYWNFDATVQEKGTPQEDILEILQTCDALVKEGKIRTIGLSNDSAWGTMQFLSIAEKHGLPRVVTIQNEYSLLCRIFDTDLAELSHHEDVGLFCYSPLAAGIISGKYQGNVTPPDSRRTKVANLGGRLDGPNWEAATAAYLTVAEKHGLDVCQMALAWCLTRPFMTSAIFGATKHWQLENALKAADLALGQEVLDDIAAANRAHPMPI